MFSITRHWQVYNKLILGRSRSLPAHNNMPQQLSADIWAHELQLRDLIMDLRITCRTERRYFCLYLRRTLTHMRKYYPTRRLCLLCPRVRDANGPLRPTWIKYYESRGWMELCRLKTVKRFRFSRRLRIEPWLEIGVQLFLGWMMRDGVRVESLMRL